MNILVTNDFISLIFGAYHLGYKFIKHLLVLHLEDIYNVYLVMKFTIYGFLCLLIFTFTVFTQNKEPTKLTYFVEYE
jgi:hypothetical protein